MTQHDDLRAIGTFGQARADPREAASCTGAIACNSGPAGVGAARRDRSTPSARSRIRTGGPSQPPQHIRTQRRSPFLWRNQSLRKHSRRARGELKVVAALRISQRTGSSFKGEVEAILRGKELMIGHPDASGSLVVNRGTYELLKSRAWALPDGRELVEFIEDYGVVWIH